MLNDVSVSDAMFVAAFMCPAACKALLVACAGRETGAIFRIVQTQRRRYAFMLLGQAIIAFALGQLFTLGSISEVWSAMREWFALPVIGWTVAISVVTGGLALVASLAAPLWIYRHPSQAAHKQFGRRLYVLTDDVRVGIHKRWHTAESHRDRRGVLHRHFIPVFGG